MYAEIDKAIEALAKKAHSAGVTSDEAMKYSQAALNLAHAKITLKGADKQ